VANVFDLTGKPAAVKAAATASRSHSSATVIILRAPRLSAAGSAPLTTSPSAQRADAGESKDRKCQRRGQPATVHSLGSEMFNRRLNTQEKNRSFFGS
jgi:hypothetical protein